MVGVGSSMHPRAFDVFCPKAIASIRDLPDTVQDRSIMVRLDRRSPSQTIAHFRFRNAEREARPIRDGWRSLSWDGVAEEAVLPDEINDRAADNWEPLAAVADAAGNGWAERARRAAIVLSTQPIDEERAEIRLLADVRELFKRGPTKIATSTLIEDLRRVSPGSYGHSGSGRNR